MRPKSQRHLAACMAAHKLVNKLSIIIGNCDLLIQKTDPDTEQARRLAVIREVADTAVKELVEHQRQSEAEIRKSRARKAG